MKQGTPFLRKAVYLCLVGALLIPVSLISQPESRSRDGTASSGGVISAMRRNHSLSQAQLSDIDPTSETMKLATMGLRGVAVNLLWMQANEQKKKEEWDGFEATLNALIKIQPNFVRVWEYQAHNLSYNISAEFDDYEYRYSWVKKGIEFLASGIQYNLREHKILDSAGDFCGMKLGNSDERMQYRRLFRRDSDFHERLRPFVDPELYDNPFYGPDHWRLAYWWYDKSEKLIDAGATKRTNDLVYYMKRPAQIRHQAIGLENEFRTEDNIREVWREADEKWEEYGRRTITTSTGTEVSLGSLAQAFQERARLRAELDQFSPGLRDQTLPGVYQKLGFSASSIALQKRAVENVSEFEMPTYRALNEQVENEQQAIDQLIYNSLPPEKQVAGRDLVEAINALSAKLLMTERYQGTANFLYWVARCKIEQELVGMHARQNWWDADELRRKSVFDNETLFDYRTGKTVVKQAGALDSYIRVFQQYHDLFELHPVLKTGDITESIIDSCKDYYGMLSISGLTWPDNFPLQALIDRRKVIGDRDDLPVSEGVVVPGSDVLPGLPEIPGTDKDRPRQTPLKGPLRK